jgi:hypothetical protein
VREVVFNSSFIASE